MVVQDIGYGAWTLGKWGIIAASLLAGFVISGALIGIGLLAEWFS